MVRPDEKALGAKNSENLPRAPVFKYGPKFCHCHHQNQNLILTFMLSAISKKREVRMMRFSLSEKRITWLFAGLGKDLLHLPGLQNMHNMPIGVGLN
jgi:hypothetical protein